MNLRGQADQRACDVTAVGSITVLEESQINSWSLRILEPGSKFLDGSSYQWQTMEGWISHDFYQGFWMFLTHPKHQKNLKLHGIDHWSRKCQAWFARLVNIFFRKARRWRAQTQWLARFAWLLEVRGQIFYGNGATGSNWQKHRGFWQSFMSWNTEWPSQNDAERNWHEQYWFHVHWK